MPRSDAVMAHHVKGSFFAEYVNMLCRREGLAWRPLLCPEDWRYVDEPIDAEAWYPMATFERLGTAIAQHVEGATPGALRLWGRFSASRYANDHPQLVAPGEPAETLMRAKVLRATLFDFPVLSIPMIGDGFAHVEVVYGMESMAEQVAGHRALGFHEAVVELAGAKNVRGAIRERSWEGDPRTLIDLEWDEPS